MKKTFKTALVIVFVAISSWVSAQYNIVGEWFIVEDNDTSSFVFDTDGYVTMKTEGEVLNGHDYDYSGERAAAKYIAKYNGKICKLDLYILLLDNDSTIALVAPALIEFIDANTIKINWNMEHDEIGELSSEMLEQLRPKDFSDPEETAILKRFIKK